MLPLTLILNTSPSPAHPSTRLVEETVASLWHHCPALRTCRLLLVADGHKPRASGYRLKAGQVDGDLAARYAVYLRRLQHLTQSRSSLLFGAQLLVLKEHHGCAHAFRRALHRTTTPYVLALQHDRPLAAPLDVLPLLAALDAPGVHYISIATAASVSYPAALLSRGFSPALFEKRMLGGVELRPLAAFLDSSHVARTDWYRSFVFGRERPVKLPRGAFLEDTFGQHQLALVREKGRDTLERYGTWLAASAVPVVTHLDGHDSRASRPDWVKWRHAELHSCTEEEVGEECMEGLAVHGWLDGAEAALTTDGAAMTLL